ncbi:hypothetical protein ACEWY4_024710 [Coilia grayii]|uniref:Uncharacterized protein n=1 Tax=Coilia grayii TaxID=363190 RepID=A0ABD1IYJ5_9TELE
MRSVTDCEMECSAQTCEGQNIKYRTCSNVDCPPESGDFRSQQCSAHADVRHQGQFHEWLPVDNDPDNPCALKCRARATGLVVELAPKVLDGTRCYTESLDMCISGVCQIVGCDHELGSTAKEDNCGVCNGDGSSCRLVRGHYKSQHASGKTEDTVVTIPFGSRHVRLVLKGPDHLFLESKTLQGLRGELSLALDAARHYVLENTTVDYQRLSDKEVLRITGPLGADFTVKVTYSLSPLILSIPSPSPNHPPNHHPTTIPLQPPLPSPNHPSPPFSIPPHHPNHPLTHPPHHHPTTIPLQPPPPPPSPNHPSPPISIPSPSPNHPSPTHLITTQPPSPSNPPPPITQSPLSTHQHPLPITQPPPHPPNYPLPINPHPTQKLPISSVAVGSRCTPQPPLYPPNPSQLLDSPILPNLSSSPRKPLPITSLSASLPSPTPPPNPQCWTVSTAHTYSGEMTQAMCKT